MRGLAFKERSADPQRSRSQRPVDLAHLSRQTMGDRSLERDVLQMFIEGAKAMSRDLSSAAAKNAPAIAHKLKGSARAVGAFRLSELAASCETRTPTRALLNDIRDEIARIEDFVASTQR